MRILVDMSVPRLICCQLARNFSLLSACPHQCHSVLCMLHTSWLIHHSNESMDGRNLRLRLGTIIIWDVCKYLVQIIYHTNPLHEAIVSTHAFTTSQSAKAHLIFFSHIFEIAKSDTGLSVKFHHIDGSGIHSVVADGHKGQGLGKHHINKSVSLY